MHTSFTVMVKVGKLEVVPIGTGLLPKTRQVNENIRKHGVCHYAQASVEAAGRQSAGAGKRGLGHAMVLRIECELDGISGRCILNGRIISMVVLAELPDS